MTRPAWLLLILIALVTLAGCVLKFEEPSVCDAEPSFCEVRP